MFGLWKKNQKTPGKMIDTIIASEGGEHIIGMMRNTVELEPQDGCRCFKGGGVRVAVVTFGTEARSPLGIKAHEAAMNAAAAVFDAEDESPPQQSPREMAEVFNSFRKPAEPPATPLKEVTDWGIRGV